MLNLVFVRLAGARPRIGEIVTPGVYFSTFYLFRIVSCRPPQCRHAHTDTNVFFVDPVKFRYFR